MKGMGRGWEGGSQKHRLPAPWMKKTGSGREEAARLGGGGRKAGGCTVEVTETMQVSEMPRSRVRPRHGWLRLGVRQGL